MDSLNVAKVLFDNIDKIHTTTLGVGRIKRNLKLDVCDEDVVEFCIDSIKRYDDIILKGKNYYVYVDDMVFTVNKNSFTIITAHSR